MEASDDDLICPITLAFFRDPVVAQDGHTYERHAIEEWVKRNGTSPVTNQQLLLENLVPNYVVKKMVDRFENSLRDKNFQYTLDVDVKKKRGRPFFQTFGKTIYHAEWLPTNENRPEVILLKIDGARANKEASFYADISRHPHIVLTYGLVRENDDRNSIMLLQEYATEGSLYEFISERKTPLKETILVEIFLQIIDAMIYLALNKIVHGDLACRNVLVFHIDENDPRRVVVKITDFGLTRHSNIYSQTTTAARTALNIIPTRYCAPEILSPNVSAEDYTEKSDVYSMGVLMWEAYSRGAIPWKNVDNDDDVIRHVKSGKTLAQPANCSPECWSIITKTWAKLPAQRSTFGQLRDLFKHESQQTTTAINKPDIRSSKLIPTYSRPLNLSERVLPSFYTGAASAFSEPTGSSVFGASGSDFDQPTSSPFSQLARSPGSLGIAVNTHDQYDGTNLVGKRISFGGSQCNVIGRLVCQNEEMYLLESIKKVTGYDGRCPKCNRMHVLFKDPSRGYYASVKTIHDKLNHEKLANERSKGRKDIDQLPCFKTNLPPLDYPIIGKLKGIEGDPKSCYMDATIFCMFAYSSVFDSLLHVQTTSDALKQLQTLLRENIVHVLRTEQGSVERDALFHLRALLCVATKDPSFNEVEKDPSEFLRALEHLFNYAPLQTISPHQTPTSDRSNVTTNIIWEMFDANVHSRPFTKLVEIFRNSLLEVPAKLATVPPFLILVAPRHTRSKRSYPYIIPDRQVSLDNAVLQLVCVKCQKPNNGTDGPLDFYSCDSCFAKDSTLSSSPSTNATIMCYCTHCLTQLHRHLPERERVDHSSKRLKTEVHKLNLFAVLCIETSHYVAFVKCHKPNQAHEWIFFDSMSDRVSNERNIPLVDRVPDFDRWINEAEQDPGQYFEDLNERRNQARPASQKFSENGMRRLRLFRDGAFFFYENENVNYQ